MPTSLPPTEVRSIDPLPERAAFLNAASTLVIPSKSFRPRVLCVSQDRLLGKTRRAILAAHYETTLVRRLDRLPILSERSFDVVVLCHTLRPEECQTCLAITERAWSGAKVVFVASAGSPAQPGADRIVHGLAGPEALLRAVRELLQPAVYLAN